VRPARRLLAAAGLLVAVAVALVGPATPTAAEAAQAAQAGGATMTLTDQTTWLHDGDAFQATVRLTDVPAGATTRVVAYGTLLTRLEFEESLTDGELGDEAYEGESVPVGPLPANGGLVTVTIPAEAELGQGVHPVEIQLLDQAGDVATSLVTYTTMLTATDGLTPLAVSVVLDISTPPALQPDGSVVMSDDALDRIDERVTVLEDAPDMPLTVAPRPETIDSLPQVDPDEGGRGFTLLGRLERATDDVPILARPFTDIDLAALIDADMVSEVNNQADAGAQVVRSRFGREPVPGVWLVSGTVGDPAARLLNQVGVSNAIVDRAAVAEAPDLSETRVPLEPIRLGDGGPEAMVNDDALAARLAGTGGVLDAQRFVAELATMWLEEPGVGRGVVVRIPAAAPLDPELVGRALDVMAEPGAVEALAPVSAPEVFTRVQPTEGEGRPVAIPAPHTVTSDLAPLKGRIERARASVVGIGNVLGSDDVTRSLQQSLLLATGSTTADDQRNAYVGRVTTELSRVEGLVDAPDVFRITLTSRSGSIPLTLTNNSDGEIRVQVNLQSDQLQFPEGDEFDQVLQPGATRIDIPVRVLASGAFPLDIEIRSADGSVRLQETRYDIRSTAVSGVGVVLSVGAIIFLALWWVRNWRATTRSKRLVPAGGAATAGPDLGEPSGEPVAGPVGAPPAPSSPAADVPTAPGPPPPPPPPVGPPPDWPPPAPGSGGPDDDYRPAHLSSPRRHR
jgi:hypothetical protein